MVDDQATGFVQCRVADLAGVLEACQEVDSVSDHGQRSLVDAWLELEEGPAMSTPRGLACMGCCVDEGRLMVKTELARVLGSRLEALRS